MERTVITFSAENIVTIFLIVAGVSALLGLVGRLARKAGASSNA